MGLFNKRLPNLIYAIKVPAIVAGSRQIYRLHETPLSMFATDYAPFNGFTIQNLSAVTLQIIFNYNDNNSLFVSTGAVEMRKEQTYCNFQVLNKDAVVAVAANEVTVWIEKT